MDPHKTEILEGRARIDQEFNHQIQIQKDILFAVDDYFKDRVKDKLQAVQQELREEGFFDQKPAMETLPDTAPTKTEESKVQKKKSQKPKIINLWMVRGLSIAASIALLIVLWFVLTPLQPNGPDLFAEQFSLPVDNLSKDLTAEVNALAFGNNKEYKQELESLLKAMTFYQSDDFPEAEKSLTDFINKYPNDYSNTQRAKYYLAYVLLKNDEAEKALPIFESLLNHPNFEDKAKARDGLYYTYLKLDRVEEAKQLKLIK